jgi:hypothetical protein
MRTPPSGAKPIAIAAFICALLTLTAVLASGMRSFPGMPASFDVDATAWPLNEARPLETMIGHDMAHVVHPL